jgi:hypothetical protein
VEYTHGYTYGLLFFVTLIRRPTIPNQAVKKQVELDEKVMELADIMSSVYDLVIKSDPDTQAAKSRIIERLVQQTIECAIFIREYSNMKTFGERWLIDHRRTNLSYTSVKADKDDNGRTRGSGRCIHPQVSGNSGPVHCG